MFLCDCGWGPAAIPTKDFDFGDRGATNTYVITRGTDIKAELLPRNPSAAERRIRMTDRFKRVAISTYIASLLAVFVVPSNGSAQSIPGEECSAPSTVTLKIDCNYGLGLTPPVYVSANRTGGPRAEAGDYVASYGFGSVPGFDMLQLEIKGTITCAAIGIKSINAVYSLAGSAPGESPYANMLRFGQTIFADMGQPGFRQGQFLLAPGESAQSTIVKGSSVASCTVTLP